jgi:hypothetical protein
MAGGVQGGWGMTLHRWGEPNRTARKTERECLHGCRTIRVTLHPDGREGRVHLVEFWRDGEKIESERTPVCEVIEVQV